MTGQIQGVLSWILPLFRLEPDVSARTGEGTSSQPRTGLLLHGQSWLLYVTAYVRICVCFSQKHRRHRNNNGRQRVSTAVTLGFARLCRHSDTTGPKHLLGVIILLRVEQRSGATLAPLFLTQNQFFVFVCSLSKQASSVFECLAKRYINRTYK